MAVIVLKIFLSALAVAALGLSSVQSPQVGPQDQPDSSTTRSAAPVVRAFPGAQGFGTRTPGGRGGRVINVTNLRDSGPGSFRAAATARGRRIVVFRVSGTITLQSDVEIHNPYITIAGQTAPGGGITLRADRCNGKGVLGAHTHDVVIRFMRFRPGPHPCYGKGESSDGIVIYKKGTHLSGWNTYNISFHHNLLAHNNDRNPQPTNPGVADIRNNVVYNYGEHAALASNSKGKPRFNFVGNYYRPGPDSDRSEYELDIYEGSDAGWAFFVKGNIGPHRRSHMRPNRYTVDPEGRPWMVHKAFRTAGVTTTSAARALKQVLARAGATFPHRDAVDRRVVRDVRNRTGTACPTSGSVHEG